MRLFGLPQMLPARFAPSRDTNQAREILSDLRIGSSPGRICMRRPTPHS